MSGKGLEGVVAAQTTLSHVYGDEGRLIYGGYDIADLAENATFEEVCHLLWYGELPTRNQLEDLSRRLHDEMRVPPAVMSVIQAGRAAHPMATLRTAVSALAFEDPDAEDNSAEANLRKSVRTTAQAIAITGAIARVRAGHAVLEARRDYGVGANLLYLMTGTEPTALQGRIMDAALTLHAEHGMNASTFAARVTVGTLADMHSGLVSAIGTLKGPLHGGANEQVMAMLEQIPGEDSAESWVRDALSRGDKIMGFGHRVYRTTDPRAPILKKLAEQLAQESKGGSKWLTISEKIQTVMREEMDKKGKKVYPNVDFFSASVYTTLGIERVMFTTVFACARMAGWTAHINEQFKDNRLIRPQSEYIGAAPRTVDSIDKRG